MPTSNWRILLLPCLPCSRHLDVGDLPRSPVWRDSPHLRPMSAAATERLVRCPQFKCPTKSVALSLINPPIRSIANTIT